MAPLAWVLIHSCTLQGGQGPVGTFAAALQRAVGWLTRRPQPVFDLLRKLRRVAQMHLRVFVDRTILGLGDHQPAAADAEVERLEQIAAFLVEHVAAGDAEIGRAVGDVGRDVDVESARGAGAKG